MNTVDNLERRTQNRVVQLFRDQLGYDYLGNRKHQDNRSIDEGLLADWLTLVGTPDGLITRALRELQQAAVVRDDRSLYDANQAVYDLLRYGVKAKDGVGEHHQTVWLIDWERPEVNHFAIAEEVTVRGDATKRPDVVLYVNGIAVGVLELKRSTVSVAEGIRQNLDNQKREFIRPFFSTIQLVMAGNDAEGLRYGAIETKEKYYLRWKEEGVDATGNPLDRELAQLCDKHRLLELIHDFTVFDAGTRKTCRHNQYFGVQAAKVNVRRRDGGVIWHTQGSGKSLTMVWLAKWILGNDFTARVLIVTDRTELDSQISDVFAGVGETIHRTKSGSDLIRSLNETSHSLICSLIHKFGGNESGSDRAFVEELRKDLPANFRAKGNLFVFVDECHRTQSGMLHDAMKTLMPEATFIGFTGTPLLKSDKQRSIETFGPYIHAYKFDEAVRDGVVLDLRYEARDIDQYLTSPKKIDQWFETRTSGMNDIARAQLKQKWGTMQKVLSSGSRLDQIVNDIVLDMSTRARLMDGRGNAMLVSASIHQACMIYDRFSKTELKGKCAVITSYKPDPASIKGEESGEGLTERLLQYDIYQQMLADHFEQPKEAAASRINEFERRVKEQFIHQPAQMRLLIVVDKLLTGFDAPPATYLYIDKQMRDHGLFQAICRVNRLDGDDKEYGYVIDYKDLFRSLEGAIKDYTSGALDGYDKEDVAGLLEDRLGSARERLDEILEKVRALCEPVPPRRDTEDYIAYFCGDTQDKDALRENEPQRLALYTAVAELIRAYAAIANEMIAAGFTTAEAQAIKQDVEHYENVRSVVKLASGDYVDMKKHEAAMRHLIDAFIRAEDSEVVSSFNDLGLVELLVQRGIGGLDQLPPSIRKSPEAMAETIENNIRKLIIDERPVNPEYYERMSELLDALIQKRRENAMEYQEYLQKLVSLAGQVKDPSMSHHYPDAVDTAGKQALYDNLGSSTATALLIHETVMTERFDGWRDNMMKERLLKSKIRAALAASDGYDASTVDTIFDLIKHQREY